MAGWARTEDPATGRTYYFNVETRETSWTWPPDDLVSLRDHRGADAGHAPSRIDGVGRPKRVYRNVKESVNKDHPS